MRFDRAAGAVMALLLAAAAPLAAAPPIAGTVRHFTPVEPPRPAPATVFADPDGVPTTLAAYRGRVVLLNFWATWCPPCIRELPTLDRLQAALGGDGFTVLLVSVDRDGAGAVRPFLARQPLLGTLRSHFDPTTALAAAVGVRQMPTTVLIDRGGRIVGRLDGVAEWDSADAQALVRHYMAAAPGG